MGSKGRVAEAYGELVYEVFKGNSKSVWPSALWDILGGINE